MPIIPGQYAGCILPLEVALSRNQSGDIVVYNRASTWSQAGCGKAKLDAKTQAVVREVRSRAPGRVRKVVSGIEKGQLSEGRPYLLQAIEFACSLPGSMIVAADLSRFIRAASYDRRKRP